MRSLKTGDRSTIWTSPGFWKFSMRWNLVNSAFSFSSSILTCRLQTYSSKHCETSSETAQSSSPKETDRWSCQCRIYLSNNRFLVRSLFSIVRLHYRPLVYRADGFPVQSVSVCTIPSSTHFGEHFFWTWQVLDEFEYLWKSDHDHLWRCPEHQIRVQEHRCSNPAFTLYRPQDTLDHLQCIRAVVEERETWKWSGSKW